MMRQNLYSSSEKRVKLTSPWFSVICLLAVNLLVGLLTFQQYGISIDEPGIMLLGKKSLQSYATLTAARPKIFSEGAYNLIYYGPFYAMLTYVSSQILHALFPGLLLSGLWHLCDFICFQTSVLLMYKLSRRWFSTWVSFAITLLFSTQPLLWGHAFINPKDTPFMTFFLASVVGGLNFTDSLKEKSRKEDSQPAWRNNFHQLRQTWDASPKTQKQFLLLITFLWLLIILTVILLKSPINRAIASIVSQFSSADPSTTIGQVFQLLAQNRNSIPLENYIHKSQLLLWYLFRLISAVSAVWIVWRWVRVFGYNWKTLQETLVEQGRAFPACFGSRSLWLAAVLLGLATSVRVGAPYAALLIAVLAVGKAGKKAIAPFAAYLLIASLVTYLTWPAMWSHPLQHFIKSAQIASNFPWQGKVLFMGEYYRAWNLPWFYLPLLFAIQFTEPLVILSLAGFLFLLYPSQKPKNLEFAFLILGWLILPLSYLMIKRPPLYDNFRQVLFLVPPIFLLAGVPLQGLFHKFKSIFLRIAVLALLAVPGIAGYLQLYPYEYAYYNSFIGGIRGADQRFETEYWKTSFRQAMTYLNTVAPPGKVVLVFGNANLVSDFARSDLLLLSKKGRSYLKHGHADYAIISARNAKSEDIFPLVPVIYTVQRSGVIFTVVKNLNLQPSP